MVLLEDNYNCSVVVRYLQKVQKKWARLRRVFIKKGGGSPDLGPYICGGGAVNSAVQSRDMGDDATHWESVGRILPQDGPQVDSEAT